MKIKILFLYYFASLFLLPLPSLADSGYKEINTSVGKVIAGLDKESALEKFGVPDQAGGSLWYYSGPESFFVLFPTHSLFNIYLYPRQSTAYVDTPLELKAYGYFSDTKIKDITAEAQLIISEPQNFVLEKAGVIIPKKAGEYQVLAKYDNIFSNPAYLKVEEPKETEKEAQKYTERLISIHILPYKPVVIRQSQWGFTALGVFLDQAGTYSIRDIANQAAWYVKQDERVTENRGNTIFFSSPGKLLVSCKYLGVESFAQEVYVQDKPFTAQEILKHITLLPAFASVANGKIINLRAYGTYHNNKVEDITDKIEWVISDKDTLVIEAAGSFLAKSAGITGVTAELKGLQSLPAKITVTDRAESASLMPPEEKKINPGKLPGDIKNEVKKLEEGLAKEERKLSLIRITPDILEVAVGETGQVKAQGIYSDNSQEDLTQLGDWSSSDDKVARVSAGKVDALSPGDARIYASFKGVNSLPASVRVTGPKLVSIILTPQSLEVSRRAGKSALKAEGYFSDSSRKDITGLVNWIITSPRIIRIDKGKILPLKFGDSAVYAEHLGIRSLAANIKVIFTLDWLVYMVIKWALFLFLAMSAVFIVLFALTEKRKSDLRSLLDKSPSEFIVGLYENTKKILAIFNLSYQECVLPVSYARLVEKSYAVENNLFLRFTAAFEEARYSHHALSGQQASLALNDYNELLKTLSGRHSKAAFFLKYCRALLRLTPFFMPAS